MKESKKKGSICGEIQKRFFELIYNSYNSFYEGLVVAWSLIAIQALQLSYFPLRRTVYLSN